MEARVGSVCMVVLAGMGRFFEMVCNQRCPVDNELAVVLLSWLDIVADSQQ